MIILITALRFHVKVSKKIYLLFQRGNHSRFGIDLYMINDYTITGLDFPDLKSKVKNAFHAGTDQVPDLNKMPDFPI